MPGVRLGPDEALLVAARGTGPQHGLVRFIERDGTWVGRHLATVNQLSSLARHPRLPVVYGTSRIGAGGEIHAWRVIGDDAEDLGTKPSQGGDPCHLVVDPGGRLLIFTNYSTSTIGVQSLDAEGGFEGPLELLRLTGSGPEIERQDDAHPHQAFFVGDTLFVIDLGADLVREYALRPGARGAAVLVAGRTTAVPSGSGPRHAVMLPDGRLAISGELGSSLLVGRPGDPVETWANVRSTRRTGPAKTRHLRNYPGDIQRSEDGRFVYFANRGHDTDQHLRRERPGSGSRVGTRFCGRLAAASSRPRGSRPHRRVGLVRGDRAAADRGQAGTGGARLCLPGRGLAAALSLAGVPRSARRLHQGDSKWQR